MNEAIEIFEELAKGRLSRGEALARLRGLENTASPAAKSAEDCPSGLELAHFDYEEAYLRDHLVAGERLLLGVTYASLALEATASGGLATGLRRLLFEEPAVFESGDMGEIRASGEETDFSLWFHKPGAKPRLTASGRRVFEPVAAPATIASDWPLNAANGADSWGEALDVEAIYGSLANVGVVHGPALRTVRRAWRRGSEILAELELSPELRSAGRRYRLHPALLDGAIVCAVGVLPAPPAEPFIPFSIQALDLLKPVPDSCLVRVCLKRHNLELFSADLELLTREGAPLVRVMDFSCKRIPTTGGTKRAEVFMTDLGRPELESRSENRDSSGVPPDPPERAAGLVKEVMRYLRKKLAENMGTRPEKIDPRSNFMDLGANSVGLIALIRELERELELELYPTLFFEYTNLEELSHYFVVNHGDKFGKFEVQSGSRAASAPGTALAQASARAQAQSFALERPSGRPEQAKPAAPREVRGGVREIAIIGMGGYFAGARSPEQFWRLLREGRDLISEVPADHFDVKPWYDPEFQKPNYTYCKWGSFIEDPARFDAAFFNISPLEARSMDPQLRLLLEVLYATAEDAGWAGRIRGTRTGMYVGVCFHDYQKEIDRSRLEVAAHEGTGNAATMLANRPSFYFNLNGPSLAVDTACSSSLVALHLAAQALRAGDCEQAFVGGVNLLLSSWHYRYFSSIGALSPTGRCHSFDAAADGYVPGEAIAAVLLKPLSQAIADGDRIHAVLKGTAVNHGGYTPSITAPSVKKEAEVLLAAWRDAGIEPSSLGYIEAHGTGTKLGDPIEVNGIKMAFKSLDRSWEVGTKPSCGLGSVKAHIGHAEGAAGLAGLVKVLLALRARELPAMPKFERLNPYVELDGSPLYINGETIPWPEPLEGGRRRAGISSFGFGGTYAHLVVEEYERKELRGAEEEEEAQLIPLSARDEERLLAVAGRLCDFLRERASMGELPRLVDLAFTCQLRREAMVERLALIATSTAELLEKLERLLRGDWEVGKRGRADAEKGESETAMLLEGEEGELFVRTVIERRNLEKLARLWVRGAVLDWRLLHEGRRFLLDLPTYPFGGGRFWLKRGESEREEPRERKAELGPARAEEGPARHLRQQRDLASLGAVRFGRAWAATDFVLADHCVNGRSLLPGVAYLEMAREAVAQSLAHEDFDLCEVRWLAPAWAEDARSLSLELSAGSTGSAAESRQFRVLGEAGFFAEGRIELRSEPLSKVRLELERIRARCSREVEGAACYARYAELGLEYGPGFQVQRRVWLGDGEALAELILPDSVPRVGRGLQLHPSLMDAALQTALAEFGFASGDELFLPQGLERLEGFAGLEDAALAYALRQASRADEVTYDLYLLDRAGKLLCKFTRLKAKKANREMAARATEPGERRATSQRSERPPGGLAPSSALARQSLNAERLLFFRPGWRPTQAQSTSAELEIQVFSANPKLAKELNATYRGEASPHFGGLLASQTRPSLWLFEPVRAELEQPAQVEEALARGPYLLLSAYQALERQRAFAQVHLMVLVDPADPLQLALAPFLRTLALEQPKRAISLLERDEESGLAEWIRAEAGCWEPGFRHLRRRGGRLEQKSWERFEPEPRVEAPEPGVYVISGGAGGLGALFARHLAGAGRQLILVGRSELGPKQAQLVEELRGLGSQVNYLTADLAESGALVAQLKGVLREGVGVKAVYHAAGLLRDGLALQKKPAHFAEVLAPKLAGTLELLRALREHPVETMVFFSSLTAVVGNPGQSDYAYANGFLDGLALSGRVLAKRVVSINWPLWREGGMRIDARKERQMLEKFGLAPLESEAGLWACAALERSAERQAAVLCGEQGKIHAWLGVPLSVGSDEWDRSSSDGRARTGASKEETAARPQWSKADLLAELTEILAAILEVGRDDLAPDQELAEYGTDSIAMMRLQAQIEAKFQVTVEADAAITHHTLEALSQYLFSLLLARSPQSALSQTRKVASPSAIPSSFTSNSGELPSLVEPGPIHRAEAIAVIGMACRFPGAADLASYWRNLCEGAHLVTEIPASRWRLEGFYDPDKRAPQRSYSKWGAFLEEVSQFDPEHFGMSLAEAAMTDPQHRMLLMLAEELFADAGYRAEELDGSRTAVFIGGAENPYTRRRMADLPPELMKKLVVGMIGNMMAARLADRFNLRSAAQTLDTACSAGLVALHQAIRALQDGDAELAVVGGIELLLDPTAHLGFSKAGVLADDGMSRVFDRRAQGFALGEGAGLLLLKPLSRALADGDQIHALIRGSAVNNDGRTVGLTTPNGEAQKEVIRRALELSGVHPERIGYFEAHGTGTLLGDPIEIKAASEVYREWTTRTGYCAVASVKSNMGHLSHAAGTAGLIKLLLALELGKKPPTLHCEDPHPRFHFENSPFYPIAKLESWPEKDGARLGAVSSFGFGGTNAHVIASSFQAPPNYTRLRFPLPPPQFRLQPCWLAEPEKSDERGRPPREALGETLAVKGRSEADESFFLGLLEGLKSGELGLEEGLALASTHEQQQSGEGGRK